MCQNKDCRLILNVVMGGLEALGGQLEAAVNYHGHSCFQVVCSLRYFLILWTRVFEQMAESLHQGILSITIQCLLKSQCSVPQSLHFAPGPYSFLLACQYFLISHLIENHSVPSLIPILKLIFNHSHCTLHLGLTDVSLPAVMLASSSTLLEEDENLDLVLFRMPILYSVYLICQHISLK